MIQIAYLVCDKAMDLAILGIQFIKVVGLLVVLFESSGFHVKHGIRN